tara:strand:+ start:170 stop:901 length:732 start_codon:yes stop_codon:yes gene_type:complete
MTNTPDESNSDEPELVKMSVLSKRSGVPAPTIKHYIREGLLPPPAVRTSRNMAYYDASIIPRIEAIKELQRTRFLPLKVIKDILEGAEAAPDDRTTVEVIAKVIKEVSPSTKQTREQVLQMGIDQGELSWLEKKGFLSPTRESGETVYRGDDLSMIQVVCEARASGITKNMVPIESLAKYRVWVSQLVKNELKLFREDMMPLAGEELASVAEASMKMSERLVAVLRRRAMIQTMAEILQEETS